MKMFTIKNNQNDYNVILGDNTFSYFLANFNFPRKVFIVSSDNIIKNLGNQYSFDSFDLITVEEGEKCKNLSTYEAIIKELIKKEYSKTDLIIGIGGGAILDLCGFVSSTYKRGINYIMVPTTLLSMVDASIGGKNALNIGNIKNAVGSFYMPNMIIDSLDILESLSDDEIVSGLMESLKMGILLDKELVNLIKDNDVKKIRNNIFLLEEIIERSIKAKKKVVEEDPYEKDYRMILNLGHTIGHAIEGANIGKITHGEAIAIGMIPFLGDKIKEEIKSIIKKYIKPRDLDLSKDKLLELIKEDKKIRDNTLNIVYVDDYEESTIEEMTLDTVKEKLNDINIWK
ncbi:MAG: 3-dehydroquinate synthase [Bacilli bacterium]|nr:3-dehydroquinate synthase [Bacilli bacterium]